MAQTTNNYEVAQTLIFKGVVYSFLDGFLSYPYITIEELRDMPESLRNARENAFYSWIESKVESNPKDHIVPGFEARRLNTNDCAIQSFYRLAVQARNGTAHITGTPLSHIIIPAGTDAQVYGEPDHVAREIDGWYDVTDDPDSSVRLSADNPFTFQNITRDTILELRYYEVKVYKVIAQNRDGRGAVSGGGTVLEGDVVFISSVNRDPVGYGFSGWYAVSTGEKVAATENYYYTPNAAHADENGSVYLESRYYIIPVLVTYAIGDGEEIVPGGETGQGTWRFELTGHSSRPVSCDIVVIIDAKTFTGGVYLGGIQITIAAGTTVSSTKGSYTIDYDRQDGPVFSVASQNIKYCGEVPIQVVLV